VLPSARPTGAALGIAGVLHIVRLARWAGDRTFRDRLVLILHVGYAFVPLGFLLAGAAVFGLGEQSAAIHAWMVGAAGVMTLAVMTRASLGHTGNALVASAATPAVSAGSLRQAAATSQTPSATAPAGPSTLSSGVAAGGLKGSSATPTFVNVSRLPLLATTGSALTAGTRLPLLVGNSAAYQAAKSSPASTPGIQIGPQSVSQVDLAFPGINSFSEAVVQGGAVEPPDTQMAVGFNQVVEMVNQTGQVYDKVSHATIGPNFSLATFFLLPAVDPNYLASDPRILYDRSMERWYATMLGFNLSTNRSTVFLAVSTSSDATGVWHVYHPSDGAGKNANGSNLLCDQPKLGYSADKITIACTDFDNGSNFYGAVFIVASKSQAVAGAPLSEGTAGPLTGFGVVPAQDLSVANPAFMVENLSNGPAPSAAVRLWGGAAWCTASSGSTALRSHNRRHISDRSRYRVFRCCRFSPE